MNKHSFNVDIATKYGIEKAILLDHFYFWCTTNKANRRNIHDGKANTYNTAEAFAEIFPYLKPRKIAQLLREMEADNLIISGQFNKYDRTKSYTLTDIALSYYEYSNIPNLDNETYQNETIKTPENVSCLNSDINTDINTDINNTDRETLNQKQKNVFKKPTLEEITAYCQERKNNINPSQFINYYESKGWIIGKSKMKDWKAAVRTWEHNNYNNFKSTAQRRNGRESDYERMFVEIEKKKKEVIPIISESEAGF